MHPESMPTLVFGKRELTPNRVADGLSTQHHHAVAGKIEIHQTCPGLNAISYRHDVAQRFRSVLIVGEIVFDQIVESWVD